MKSKVLFTIIISVAAVVAAPVAGNSGPAECATHPPYSGISQRPAAVVAVSSADPERARQPTLVASHGGQIGLRLGGENPAGTLERELGADEESGQIG